MKYFNRTLLTFSILLFIWYIYSTITLYDYFIFSQDARIREYPFLNLLSLMEIIFLILIGFMYKYKVNVRILQFISFCYILFNCWFLFISKAVAF